MSQDIRDTHVSRHRKHRRAARCSAMSKARLVITALFVENQTPSEVAARYGVDRSWVYRLKARYEAEGEAAFEPRSRRPKTSPNATAAADRGAGAGAAQAAPRGRVTTLARTPSAGTWPTTISVPLSRATVHRILARHGAVTPEPKKRPKSSYIRFQAEQPNETWQSDFTHYRLTPTAPGADVEVITWLDDHSRYALHVSAHHRITAQIVLDHVHRNRRPARLSRIHPDR